MNNDLYLGRFLISSCLLLARTDERFDLVSYYRTRLANTWIEEDINASLRQLQFAFAIDKQLTIKSKIHLVITFRF